MRQNNPLLYIFVGMPDDSALSQVREIQSKRVDIKGVGYLSIGEYSKDRLLDEIRAVQSRFLTKIYVTSGEIKVVYVVNADGAPAAELSAIKRDVDAYLQYLYPGGILADIFLLLDDAVDLTAASHRGAVIDMLEELYSDTCMLYMLSNVNSKKLYEADAHRRILHCIALMGIMKDYVSLQSSEQIYRWYNERYFKEDCYRNGERFLTVGYLSIQRPVEIIKKLLLIELLTCRELKSAPECGFAWSSQSISDESWAQLKENIHGLGINAEFFAKPGKGQAAGVDMNRLDSYTNAQALELLFGNRLDRFFEVNFKAEHVSDGVAQVRRFLQDCARDPNKGFFYIHAATAPDGALRRYLKGLLADTRKSLDTLDSRAAGWRNERCSPPKRLLNSARMPEYVYELAAAYLEPRFDRLQPELELKRLTAAIEYVDTYHRELSRNRDALAEFIAGCRAEVTRLQESEDLFFQSANLNSYYTDRLRDFIKTDKRFDAIYSRLWRSFEKPGLQLYVAELESYINNAVMPQEAFKQGVVNDLAGLYGGDAGRGFYDQIWEFVIENRYFNILLKSGGKTMHSEINVFMDASGQMARWAGSGAASREKINFFYENNSDTIDVLYHGGAFSSGDLYYDALYRGAAAN